MSDSQTHSEQGSPVPSVHFDVENRQGRFYIVRSAGAKGASGDGSRINERIHPAQAAPGFDRETAAWTRVQELEDALARGETVEY